MIRAAVLSEHDFDTYQQGHRAGTRPTPLPYDLQKLEPLGWRLRSAARRTNPAITKVRDVIEHRAGFPIEQTVRLAPAVAGADVVLALLETQGLAAVRAKAAGVWPYSRRPLVVWSCWLAENLSQMPSEQRRLAAKAWQAADLITTYSVNEVEVLVDSGLSPERVAPVLLGANDYYQPDPTVARDAGLVAIGQDRGRDYATLFEAVRGTELQLTVVCKPENLAGLDVPPNVTVVGTIPHAEYRQLLQRAAVVVIPTHDLAYPTGSSVMLEASASGACIAVTGTSAMREYVADGVSGALVGVGDVDGWRTTLRRLLADDSLRNRLGAGARQAVDESLSTTVMWTNFDRVVRERLDLEGAAR